MFRAKDRSADASRSRGNRLRFGRWTLVDAKSRLRLCCATSAVTGCRDVRLPCHLERRCLMSSRDALRKLSRKKPSRPEIEKIIDSLAAEPDLSCAMLASALVESALEKLILTKFYSKRKEMISSIFMNRGPLMDFNSKILIAEAFGIITGPMAQEFHSIRVIRNAFAHTNIPLDFGNEIIEREVKSMAMGSAIRRRSAETGPEMTLENRTWYVLTARMLLIIMETLEDSALLADRAIADVLRE